MTLLASKAIDFGEKKTQNKGFYAVQGHRGRYQSKACMRLSITRWRFFLSHAGTLAPAYCKDDDESQRKSMEMWEI